MSIRKYQQQGPKMQLRKYRVRNMSEGLERIKGELGEDAVILSTTRLSGQGGDTLEITVAPGDSHSARAMVGGGASPHGNADTLTKLVEQITQLQSEVRHLRLERELRADDSAPAASNARVESSTLRTASPTRVQSGLQMAMAMMHSSPAGSSRSRALSSLFQGLSTNGVLDFHVEEVVGACFASVLQLNQKGPAEIASQPNVMFAQLERELANRLDTTLPLWHQCTEQPQLSVFFGPTGVGKTTTIAKIAGQARFVGQRNVGIICADTFRIGGVYQLETYAELIGVPMLVASNFSELTEALESLEGCDLILVDTTGHNPWANARDHAIPLEDYHRLGEVYDVALNLCLSATTRTEDLVSMLDRYVELNPSSLIFTKVDEAQGLGCLLSASMVAGIPISHVCHGQSVPDDIACPTPSEIARWIRTLNPYAMNDRLAELMMQGATDATSRATAFAELTDFFQSAQDHVLAE